LRPARAVPLAALPPTIPLVPPSCLAARSIRRLCWPPEQAAAAMSSVMISCTHSTSSFHRRSSINKEHVPSPPVSRRRSDSRRCRHVLPTMSSSTRSPPSSLPLAQPNRIAGSPVRPLQSLARNGSCPPLRHGHRTRGERQRRYRQRKKEIILVFIRFRLYHCVVWFLVMISDDVYFLDFVYSFHHRECP
jgi:hypothetical protein